jgi:ATP-dependent Clp protease ATP-binding subunit ClpB
MSITKTQLDEELGENIVLAAHVSSTIVLAGLRQFDRFLIGDAEGGHRTQMIERVCHASLRSSATWVFDPSRDGSVVLSIGDSELDLKTSLPAKVGVEKNMSLIDVFDAFSSLNVTDAEAKFVLVVNASLLVEDSASPRDDDFSLMKIIERFSRSAERTHTLFLRVGKTTAVPNRILSSPFVRVVHIPAASRDVRYAYSYRRGELVAKNCEVGLEDMANTSSNATEDWTLEQVNALFQTAESQTLSRLNDFEELARAIRIGTTNSPWAGDRIRGAVASAKDDLTKRVLGQPTAVDAVVSSLKKAVVGLATAHQNQGSQAPRAVFFFSGPTGTGKTELAKAISKLVFGQEQILRFDCGELRQEHAVARLIGAPPGYVGYDAGGELTEGIRAKPNSVVLFDEIEKAHPRLLDTLMSVLDEGRLTSGQGETAFFGQSILIFTSNLGMYEEVNDTNGMGGRRPRFNYDTPFEEIENKVREAIREEFVSVLGRPELLGRFEGAKSIVVFDFLRDVVNVCRKFVANISTTCERLYGIKLIVDDSIIEQVVGATKSRPDALILGGRGLKPELDRMLTNPLADYLFKNPIRECELHALIEDDHTVFSVQS